MGNHNTRHKERLASLSDEQAQRYAKLLNTSIDKIRHLETHYIACDEASNGKITKEAFVNNYKVFYAQKSNSQHSNALIEQVFDIFDVNNDGQLSFEEFLAGNIYLTGDDKKKSLEIIFTILDLDKDGWITLNELQVICTASRGMFEGDLYMSSERNTFEKKGAEDAARLMKKLDDKNQNKISKEALISHLMNDPELQALQKRFSLTSATRPVLSEGTGAKPMSLGDLL